MIFWIAVALITCAVMALLLALVWIVGIARMLNAADRNEYEHGDSHLIGSASHVNSIQNPPKRKRVVEPVGA